MKMEMGLPNFGLGDIAPPTLIEEDMEFMAAWRRTLKATSERLTAMATEKIRMELEKTKREILLMKNQVPEEVLNLLEENNTLLTSRLNVRKTKKVMNSLKLGRTREMDRVGISEHNPA